ncbi:ATP-binding cassette domain-containing protein [Rhodobacter sp. NTK016B]|uniref:ABC transporter ATP-binding protein n=1 Tax=Rhodobacter sp. NTK016B TaxID=2759676 RepID=UPI001A8FF461|nr:ATP-binding cassette domain-containing protein [Rhodobacter sp. NTK016B]MBN8294848.1 ATP-binding cassette domain-containing protein [Rhodobacter sp. NTK016B]
MPLLEIDTLAAHHGELVALDGLSFALAEHETLALVGANGAGKTTLMRVLCGLMAPTRGTIRVQGHALKPGDPLAAARAGLALVPEGRLLFDSLTIEENLLIGQSGRTGIWSLDEIYGLFPVLREKRRLSPAALSGGQQQMAAIGRALAANPRVLLCDEISLGLSPLVTDEVYVALKRVRDEGTALIIVDQDVTRAARIADRVACMFKGRVTYETQAATANAATLKNAYFGLTA